MPLCEAQMALSAQCMGAEQQDVSQYAKKSANVYRGPKTTPKLKTEVTAATSQPVGGLQGSPLDDRGVPFSKLGREPVVQTKNAAPSFWEALAR